MDVKEKFTGMAQEYSAYRPNYPSEYISYLYEKNHLSNASKIADIGSGTGILTKLLLDRNIKVIAVEPNDDMRKVAEQRLSSYPNFISINGSAENTAIDSHSLDLITVAQAFHWFDVEEFKLECKRILKEDKNVALVWNSRDTTSSLVLENAEICKSYCPLFNGFSGGIEDTPEKFDAFFKNGDYKLEVFDYPIEYTIEQFIGRNLSASYAPKVGDKHYQTFIDELTKLFQKHQTNNRLSYPNIVRSYIGKV